MSGARDHLDRREERSGHAPPRAADPESATTPAIAGPADPRLEHGGAAAAGDLMHLQRTAGNAAVTSLVGGPMVQRAVTLDEFFTDVDAPQEATPETATEPGAPAGGPVTSDGSTTTISGGAINLAAPITQSDGIIRADTIIANSVVASSYTPGAGNEW